MASSKLMQFRTKAVEASKLISDNGANCIKQLKEMNQQQWLHQYRAKAGEASKVLSENGTNYYKQLSDMNPKQVQEKLRQMGAKAAETPKRFTRNGSSYYKQLLERNQQYVRDPPTVEACQELQKQFLYTSLASIPHRYGLVREEVDALKELMKNWNKLTPQHYGILTLFGGECCLWALAGKFLVSW